MLYWFKEDPLLVPVTAPESEASLVPATVSGSISVTDTANVMHLALQMHEAVQKEEHQLMGIYTKLTQEVQEDTDWLARILANTQDLLEQKK